MAFDNTWVLDVETDIYTIIKTRLMSRLSSEYADLFITQDDETNTKPSFPTIYIHFLGALEIGRDIEAKTINGIRSTVEWIVVASAEQGKNCARDVAGHVISAFKELGFDGVSLAEFRNKSQDTVRMVGRVRRDIGQADTLN